MTTVGFCSYLFPDKLLDFAWIFTILSVTEIFSLLFYAIATYKSFMNLWKLENYPPVYLGWCWLVSMVCSCICCATSIGLLSFQVFDRYIEKKKKRAKFKERMLADRAGQTHENDDPDFSSDDSSD